MFFIYFIFFKKWFGLRRSRANELVFAYLLSILPLRKIQYTSWISHMVIDWTIFLKKGISFLTSNLMYLIGPGTQRLPRLVGISKALEMMLVCCS